MLLEVCYFACFFSLLNNAFYPLLQTQYNIVIDVILRCFLTYGRGDIKVDRDRRKARVLLDTGYEHNSCGWMSVPFWLRQR